MPVDRTKLDHNGLANFDYTPEELEKMAFEAALDEFSNEHILKDLSAKMIRMVSECEKGTYNGSDALGVVRDGEVHWITNRTLDKHF